MVVDFDFNHRNIESSVCEFDSGDLVVWVVQTTINLVEVMDTWWNFDQRWKYSDYNFNHWNIESDMYMDSIPAIWAIWTTWMIQAKFTLISLGSMDTWLNFEPSNYNGDKFRFRWQYECMDSILTI